MITVILVLFLVLEQCKFPILLQMSTHAITEGDGGHFTASCYVFRNPFCDLRNRQEALADKQSHRAAVLGELTDLKEEETKGHGTLTMAAVIYTSGRRGAVFLSIQGADRESCFCQADD